MSVKIKDVGRSDCTIGIHQGASAEFDIVGAREVGVEVDDDGGHSGLYILKRKKFLKAVAKELDVCIHDDAAKLSYYPDGDVEQY